MRSTESESATLAEIARLSDDAEAARLAHRASEVAAALAENLREERDRRILLLRQSDPLLWSYAHIAAHLGVSKGLVAIICRRELPRTERRA